MLPPSVPIMQAHTAAIFQGKNLGHQDKDTLNSCECCTSLGT